MSSRFHRNPDLRPANPVPGAQTIVGPRCVPARHVRDRAKHQCAAHRPAAAVLRPLPDLVVTGERASGFVVQEDADMRPCGH